MFDLLNEQEMNKIIMECQQRMSFLIDKYYIYLPKKNLKFYLKKKRLFFSY